MSNGSGNVSNVIGLGGSVNAASPLVLPVNSGLTNLISLVASIASSTPAHYLAMYKLSNGTQYQVSTGKTFVAFGIMIRTATQGDGVTIGTATASFSNDASSAPTGAVYFSAGSSVATVRAEAAGTHGWIPMTFQFPSDTFPFMQTLNTGEPYEIYVVGQEF